MNTKVNHLNIIRASSCYRSQRTWIKFLGYLLLVSGCLAILAGYNQTLGRGDPTLLLIGLIVIFTSNVAVNALTMIADAADALVNLSHTAEVKKSPIQPTAPLSKSWSPLQPRQIHHPRKPSHGWQRCQSVLCTTPKGFGNLQKLFLKIILHRAVFLGSIFIVIEKIKSYIWT